MTDEIKKRLMEAIKSLERFEKYEESDFLWRIKELGEAVSCICEAVVDLVDERGKSEGSCDHQWIQSTQPDHPGTVCEKCGVEGMKMVRAYD